MRLFNQIYCVIFGFFTYNNLSDVIPSFNVIWPLIILVLLYIILNSANIIWAFEIQLAIPHKWLKIILLSSLLLFAFWQFITTPINPHTPWTFIYGIDWTSSTYFYGLFIPMYINVLRLAYRSDPNVNREEEPLDSEL